ncbi:hypothetical protein [Azospirillum sp. B506]|uniref:hypothetical protein n=1 Tax=Azospirillum sp. B506 TaxID=137721 RepID=UPI0005B2CE50|nr:hypothetical protein [Azospirillum sp. B506]
MPFAIAVTHRATGKSRTVRSATINPSHASGTARKPTRISIPIISPAGGFHGVMLRGATSWMKLIQSKAR